jgi:undecaprenyl-diphosphatase
VFCTVFGPEGFRLLGAVVILIALIQRNLRTALFLVVTMEISGVATQVGKYLAHRPRPSGALAYAPYSAFPSGHALAAMAAVLALLTVSAGLLALRARTMTVIAGAMIVVAVGVGRVVLNVHHPADVLAGWALGYLWFVLSLVLIRPEPLRSRAAPPVTADAALAEIPEVRGSAR